MIAIPFVYFTTLFTVRYLRNKRTIDLAGFVLLIYVISGYFSIQIDLMGLRSVDTKYYDISVISSLSYCALVTLCILPISKIKCIHKLKVKPLSDDRWIKVLSFVFCIYFIFYIYMSYGALSNSLSGNIADIRNDIYNGLGEKNWMNNINPILRFPFALINIMLACPWITQFLAFFILLIQKMQKKYSIMMLFASCTSIVDSFVGADRSGVAYWILGFIACFIFYKPIMSKPQKKFILRIMSVLLCLFILYLAYVTISRFGDSSNITVENSLISYLGQSYINFCYFFDEFECPYPTLFSVFPFLSHITFGELCLQGSKLNIVLSSLSGKNLGVFYTFIGDIITKSGKFIAILYCLFFSFISYILLRRRSNSMINISYMYNCMLLSSFLFLGIFIHYYGYYFRSLSVILYFVIFKYISRK